MIKIIIIFIYIYIIFYIINIFINKYDYFSNKNINININDNITIILTTTINVQNKKFLYQIDKNERIKTYLKSIKQWLDKTTFNIIVVENSGYLFEELYEYLNKYKDRFEIISFDEKKLKDAAYLKNNLSKGASEIFSINYAYNKSININKSIFIIKITGRYFIPEFNNYLLNFNMNNYDILFQNNINRCEMVGCHKKLFFTIFDINLLNKYNKYDGHIENIFKYRIHDNILNYKKIKCKIFNIDPTQRGGVKQIFDNI